MRLTYLFCKQALHISEFSYQSEWLDTVERNKEPEGYLPGVAQLKTDERAQQKRPNKIEKDGYLKDYVVRSLKKGWSPDQISGRRR